MAVRGGRPISEPGGPVVDVAGAVMGGAGRWLSELDRHVSATGAHVLITGRGQPIAPRALLAREAAAVRARPRRVVATNNLSFLAPGVAQRVVLVRNALHFLGPQETRELDGLAARPWERQAAVVRRLLRRATLIVVPSTSMADRVGKHVPTVSDRIVVRFHPISPQISTGPAPAGPGFRFLCPVLDAPFKRLDLALRPVLEALDAVASQSASPPFSLEITMSPGDARSLTGNRPWLVPLGRLSVGQLDVHRRTADALVYPTSIESFGYPLAEARAEGRWVLAPSTAHNVEVAGAALVPCPDDPDTLGATIQDLLAGRRPRPDPDPLPFSPAAYFSWLLGAGGAA